MGDFGPVAEVSLPLDKKTNKPKGYAVVTFMIPEHAVKAYSNLDGTVFQGRMLHILAGKEKPGEEGKNSNFKLGTGGRQGLSEFQKQKLVKLKSAAKQCQNWNSLFLGASAVADALAVKLDAQKSEILNPESKSSLGVRMALGETRLVKETRDFLLSHGVALDSFGRAPASGGARSKLVILAKNLPANTSPDQLREKFGKFGLLGRVLLPPAGVTALVEFLEPEGMDPFRNYVIGSFV